MNEFDDENPFDDDDYDLEAIQEACDHDWEDIGNGRNQCTYPDCQLVELQ